MKYSATIMSVVLASAVLYAGLCRDAEADELNGLDCIVQPYMTVELSSAVAGVIESINVDRSDTVRKGQILANLKSDVEQVKYRMAQVRAKYQGDLEASKVNLGLTDREYKRIKDLYKEKVVSLSEKEKTEANLELAKYEYDRAAHENEVLDLELDLAKSNLELRQISSPIDGVVVERFMTPGEYVENKPVLKVAQLHPLRIEVISSVSNFGKIRTGMHAQVIPEFGNYSELVAEVVVVDKVIDAASGTFGVRLLLDNQKFEIPGGLKCKLNFFSAQQEAAYLKKHIKRISHESREQDDDSGQTGERATDTTGASDDAAPARYCATLTDWKDKKTLQDFIRQLDDAVSSSSISSYSDDVVNWLVLSEAFDTRQAAGTKLDEIHNKGITDAAILPSGDHFRISFGLFTSEKSAQQRQQRMSDRGYQTGVSRSVKSRDRYRAEVFLTKGVDSRTISARLNNASDSNKITIRQCVSQSAENPADSV